LQILTAIAAEIDSLKHNVERRFTMLENLVQQNMKGEEATVLRKKWV
jgi:hypothetical protein